MSCRNIGRYSNAANRLIRVGRVLAVSIAVLTLNACGTQFAYNRVDWLMHHYLSNQVTLDAAQSRELRVYLDEFFIWHRQHELPRYADFLDRVADATAKPISFDEFEAGRHEVEGFMRTSVSQGAPSAARWLRSLRPAQVEELFASFAEKDRESHAEACESDPEERRADNLERMIDNVERWTGRLRSSQRTLIATRLAAFPGDSCAESDSDDDARYTFRDIVDEYRSRPDFAQRITVFMTRPEDHGDAEYRRTFEANRDRVMLLLVDLNHSLSEEQRARAIKRLHSLSTDLRELAAEPVS